MSERMIAGSEQAGIDTALVRRHQRSLPGVYAIETDAQCERRSFYWHDEAAALAAHRKQGVKMVFDSNVPAAFLPDRASARANMAAAMTIADIARVRLDDEQPLHGEATAETCAARLVAQGPAAVVGAAPAVAAAAGGRLASHVVRHQGALIPAAAMLNRPTRVVRHDVPRKRPSVELA